MYPGGIAPVHTIPLNRRRYDRVLCNDTINTNMTTIMASRPDTDTLLEEVRSLKKLIFEELIPKLGQREIDLRNRWLKTRDVVQLLELSAKTLQNLRRNGTLPFSKIGGTIFYELDDIDRILHERKQVRATLERKRKSRSRKSFRQRPPVRVMRRSLPPWAV